MPEPIHTSIRISRRAAERLRAGHLWIYRSELGDTEGGPEPGALVTVEDTAGRALGTALYSSASQIALRLVSRTADLTRDAYLADVQARIAEAFARRRVVAPLNLEWGTGTGLGTNAQRLIFSEADGLPGIVADRYADLVIMQLLTQGTAQDDLRAALVMALRERLSPAGESLTIWERPDPRIREMEELAPPSEGPLYSSEPDSATARFRTHFALNGLRFGFDASAGQKTGAFLDQRLNYAAAAGWVQQSGCTGHALDVCTYQGGFALHLARVCARVTGIDQSRSALEAADSNLALNPDLPAAVDWIEADAFEFLRALDGRNREPGSLSHGGLHSGARRSAPGDSLAGLPAQFDVIVLDPPAFAKSRRAAEDALRGYKELNLRAMRLLAPGGTLVTCSCSHHVSAEAFLAVVTEAAADAGRRVQLLEARSAAPDHPEMLSLPETRYLKCLVCRVE